jgi:hypothetical protein
MANLRQDLRFILLTDHRHELDLPEKAIDLRAGHVLQDRPFALRTADSASLVDSALKQAGKGLPG